ncbi:uncharacterized protein BJX67DRAFT_383032 [Aspergillus lucknowensis]|uniref:F-box domain-containing protein n=1 Tax=Aspergillus lucknowensis TaxID=176173 RepID=A0ABR4LL64_9EURO
MAEDSLYQLLWNGLSTLTGALFGSEEERKDPAIFALSPPLLREIFDLLSPIDQICLFLSCVKFYREFEFAVNYDEFSFPRLLHTNTQPSANPENVPRNQLLVRLEDSRWAFCSACVNLHRRKEFTPRSALKISPFKRRCMPNAGIVDLCPCASVTYRDCLHIAKYLRETSRGNPVRKPRARLRQVFGLLDLEGQRFWVHRCFALGDANTKVDLSYGLILGDRPSLGIADGPLTLSMLARYTIHCNPLAPVADKPVFCCPHQDLLDHIRSGEQWRYLPCGVRIFGPRSESDSPSESVTMLVVRPLGNGGWPAGIGWH